MHQQKSTLAATEVFQEFFYLETLVSHRETKCFLPRNRMFLTVKHSVSHHENYSGIYV